MRQENKKMVKKNNHYKRRFKKIRNKSEAIRRKGKINMAEENIKNILENYKEETKRHFDVVAEDFVSRDEFAILEKRVSLLETKIK